MKKYIAITLFAGLLWSCDRDQEILGPSLDDIYGDFTVLEDITASTNQVNFKANETVIFSGRFSKSVDWEIHIIGQNSQAEKILTGKSKVVDETNGVWEGTTTVLPMFKTEPCLAYVTVPGESFSDTIGTVTIDSTRNTEGFIVADFETGMNPGWVSFAQSGANMSWAIEQSDTAAQGEHMFNMGGEVNFDYLIGLLHFPASAYNEPTFPLSDNASNVYFNVFLYKPPTITNEIILFQFREDENGDGNYSDASEDMYSLELRGLQAGWQMVSLPYADLVTLVNGQPSNPAGNGVHEPDKILQVSLLFLADPSSGYSQTYVDNIVFTEGGPIQP